MLGVKLQAGRNLGHKTLSIGGLGHKREPMNFKPAVIAQTPHPEIINNFNNSISHRQPIKNYINK